MEDYEENIRELEEEITRLKQKRNKMNMLAVDAQLAIILHDLFCKHNHTDGCSWLYNVDKDGLPKWDSVRQQYYLKKARRLLSKGYTIEKVKGIVSEYEKIRGDVV